MRAFVFTDARLASKAGRFVWLSIDGEKAANAPFLAQFPVEGYPTLFVIDPALSVALVKYPNSATTERLLALLDEGDDLFHKKGGQPEHYLAEADALLGKGKREEAAKLYEALLAKTPREWPARGRAAETGLTALSALGASDRCVALATAELPKLPRSLAWANVASSGLSCAEGLPKGAAREAALALFEPAVKSALGEPPIPMAGDDRSGLFEALHGAREGAGDKAGARAVASDWLAFLDGEAAKAKTPGERAVYDPHRLSACLALGDPARALPMLARSEKDFPTDFNPPARIAVVLGELGRYDEALAASDRALARVYGPRRLRLLTQRATILQKKGDGAGARKALQDAIAYAESLPPGQKSEGSVKGLKARLEAMK